MEDHREIAMRLLTSLFEVIFQQLKPHLPSFLRVVAQALQDAKPSVRLAALKCFLAILFENGVSQELTTMLPLILHVGQRSLQEDDEESVLQVRDRRRFVA
jgi:ABC-type proline/glycine betaine transport system permease subunit